MKKKILIFSNSCWNIYNFRLNLIKKLKKKNFVILVCPKDEYIDKLKDNIDKHYNLKIFKNYNLYAFILNILNFYYILKKEKPDYILSYTIKCNFYAIILSKILKIKTIVNITGLGSLFIGNTFFNIIGKIFVKLLYRSHKRLIFQNIDDAKIVFGNNYKNKQFYYVPGLGVDTNFFRPNKKIVKSNFNIFMISRVIKDKGVFEYINSVNSINKLFHNVNFYYVGNFDFDNPSKINPKVFFNLVKKNNIKYYPFTNNIRNYLRRADCIILPSYREGLSRVLLEAASMEIPIIASNVPGCKDIIKHKFNGFLCKPRSYKSLAKMIKNFILTSSFEKKKMGKMGRLLVLNKFDQKEIIMRYINILK
jgi:glycosyltransferase involved in cell wall biosynthesis